MEDVPIMVRPEARLTAEVAGWLPGDVVPVLQVGSAEVFEPGYIKVPSKDGGDPTWIPPTAYVKIGARAVLDGDDLAMAETVLDTAASLMAGFTTFANSVFEQLATLSGNLEALREHRELTPLAMADVDEGLLLPEHQHLQPPSWWHSTEVGGRVADLDRRVLEHEHRVPAGTLISDAIQHLLDTAGPPGPVATALMMESQPVGPEVARSIAPGHQENCPGDDCFCVVELTGADIPYHLQRGAPPVGECSGCHRSGYRLDDIGRACGMTQPSGERCAGRFEAIKTGAMATTMIDGPRPLPDWYTLPMIRYEGDDTVMTVGDRTFTGPLAGMLMRLHNHVAGLVNHDRPVPDAYEVEHQHIFDLYDALQKTT